MSDDGYRTIAVTPWPLGWRALYIIGLNDEVTWEEPVIAFLLQERVALDLDDARTLIVEEDTPPAELRYTRVVPGIYSEDVAEVVPADDGDHLSFWRIARPGETWTEAEVEEQRAFVKKVRAIRKAEAEATAAKARA